MEGVAILSLLIVVIIAYGFSCVQTSAIHCIESEKNALIKFSQGFKNPSRNMLSWRLDENCCQWKGVECDNTTGHVITLDLQKQFLQDYRIHEMLVSMGQSFDFDFQWLIRVIDLSGNLLSGDIPEEITSLTALWVLNLSRNHFTGAIPRYIHKMQNLESLDLSRNKLSCTFPPDIIQLSCLQVVNFSFNNLTGKVPQEYQFEIFENSSYVGNPNLCGAPLSRVCSDNLHDDMIDCSNNNNQEVHEQGENNNWLEEFSFYISMGIGFNTGFLLFWVTLMLKKSWRYAYMRCLENMGNKIYVFAAIRLRKIQPAKTVTNCPN